MKRFIYLFAVFFVAVSCNLEEINENPNVPTDVPLSTLLPPTQKALADVQGGQLFRINNIFSQHMEGISGRPLDFELYNPDELFVGNAWSDIHLGAIVNLKIIQDKAIEEGSPHYAGVAKILQAQAFGLLTDTWGDVPYFESALGPDEINPEYDSQEVIYDQIQNLLDEAIDHLEEEESIFTPGPDDIIYNGNLANWITAANLLKARYLMHTTKQDPTVAGEVLTYLSQAFTSTAQDFEYPYLGTGEDINPVNGFFESNETMIIDQDYIDLMESLSDPRLDFAFEILPFTGGQRKPGEYFASPESPVELAGYLEQLFLLAEARLRNSDTPGAQSALQEAVALSINEISFGEVPQDQIDTYLEDNANLSGSFEEDLEIIIREKYIALFTTPEPWTDFRRTGYPELQPNENGASAANPNGEIPRRLIYPQSERLRNQSFPSVNPTMQDRFWWDE
ncbi:SusD/RagB family nutrient-binding outer membrane lipoprotein [Cryomorphaceae bacterium 1068]|nr:SusD/RagB family nutrient-binding outer membrane lipoprotein [Cryomorphaceae bacterium 1068]